MHYRRLACAVLGFWLAGSICMMVVAAHNFAGADEIAASPSARASKDVLTLGKAETRLLLRHAAAELNRWYFENWERVQLGLGAALLLMLFFGADARSAWLAMTLLMLVATGVQHWLLTPQIIRLGRILDFAFSPESDFYKESHRFSGLHATYSVIELAKLALGLFLTLQLAKRSKRRSTGVRDEIDSIDDADNGHINGR